MSSKVLTHGRAVRLQFMSAAGAWTKVTGERSCVLTVETDYVKSADGRGLKYVKQVKSWKVTGKALLTNAALLSEWWLQLGAAARQWRLKTSDTTYVGSAWLSSLSWDGKKRGAVEISFGLTGTGKLEEVVL